MPRRKFFPIIVACLVSVTLIVFAVTKDQWTFAAKNTKNETLQNDGIRLVVEKALVDAAERDDDGDGIKNWEENLPKGNANGDLGVSGVQNSQTGSAAAGTYAAPGETMTQTDEISRGLFAEYMQLKQNGNLNQESLSALVDKAVAKIEGSTVKTYTAADIRTIPDTDTAGVKNYLNALVTIKEKYKTLYSQNPIITSGNSIDFDNTASTQSIRKTGDLYAAITLELKNLLVPKSLVAAHVNLLNNYSTSASGLTELSKIKTEPLEALAGIQKHINATAAEPVILADIRNFFISRNINFEISEAGSRINNI